MNSILKSAVALAATVTLAHAAEITGKVTLKGTPPPAKPIAAVKGDPTCGKFHSEDVFTRTFVVAADGGLANVVVYVKGGIEGKTFAPPAEKPLIDQVGCMYEPYVSAVQTGQTFQVRNSDPVMHNVNATPKLNKGFNFAQASAGQVNDKVFDKAELGAKFACNVHPWMIAYVSVIDNPFFAVTDKEGKFVIKGDLPDGKYTFEAFHQKAGAVTGEVEVKGGKATADFTIELKAVQ
jgi:plastocyanin